MLVIGVVVVGEHLVAEDGVHDLRCTDEIHFEVTCLEMTLFLFVLFEGIQQEQSGRLNHVLEHEYIDDPLDVNQRT